MSRLRKVKIFSYVLPVVVAIFLFSVIGTALADYFPNVYIGKISTFAYNGGVNSTIPICENMDVSFYNDSELTQLVHTSYIRTGEEYGGYPGALIATIFSSQEQRTRVSIVTDSFNHIRQIFQNDQPDDIASAVEATQGAVGEIQQTVDGVYYQVVGQTQLLNGIANLTVGLDNHLTSQDNILVKIWNAVRSVIDPAPIINTEEPVTTKVKR